MAAAFSFPAKDQAMWFAVHCMATTFSQHLQAIDFRKHRQVKNGTLPPTYSATQPKDDEGQQRHRHQRQGAQPSFVHLCILQQSPKPPPLTALTLSVIPSRLVATCRGWSNVDPSFLRSWFFTFVSLGCMMSRFFFGVGLL